VVEQCAKTILSRTYSLLDSLPKAAFGTCKKTLCESRMPYAVEFVIQNTKRPPDTILSYSSFQALSTIRQTSLFSSLSQRQLGVLGYMLIVAKLKTTRRTTRKEGEDCNLLK
jgi:hypothetical protein